MEFYEGAEARVYFKEGTVIKERIRKTYRHEAIDSAIRKSATRREAKLLEKAAAHIPVPKVIAVSDKEMVITLERIEGKKLRDAMPEIDRKNIFQRIGKKLARLHKADIIHGDLTTSNILLNDTIYFIDFGLGFVSTRIEDKAVDLHLIKKALESKHHQYAQECFTALLRGYKEENKDYDSILKRLEKVEKRGRYKA